MTLNLSRRIGFFLGITVLVILTGAKSVFAQADFPIAEVTNQDFLNDVADGVSVEEDFSLTVRLVGIAGGQYRFKVGELNEAQCNRPEGYSDWQSVNIPLVFSVDAAEKKMKLCLVGKKANVGTQPLRDATVYRWNHKIQGRRTRIVAPISPSLTTTPIVRWVDAEQVLTYTLVVATDFACENVVQQYSGLTDTWQTLSPLTDGTYFACVYVHSDNGLILAGRNNGYSWIQDAEPSVLPPEAFTIIAPSSPSTISAPTVAWTPALNADRYDLVVASDSACSQVVQTYADIIGSTQALTTLADGIYYACVNAENAGGITAASNNGFVWTQLTQSPQSFSVLGPQGYIVSATPVVEWEAAPLAETYRLRIALDSACAEMVVDYPGLLSTVKEINPIAEGVYFACVDAQNAAGSTPASNVVSFTYDVTPPAIFEITGPSAPSLDGNVTITWSAAAGVNHYQLRVGVGSDCNVDPITVDNLVTTSHALTFSFNGTYSACVSAFDEAGNVRHASNDHFAFVVDIPAAEPQLMFVSSMQISMETGDFFPPFLPLISNIESADWACTYLANEAGLLEEPWNTLDIVYKAFMSDGSEDAAARANFRSRIVNMRGEEIASSAADLLDGSIQRPVIYNEFGNAVSATARVWTGTNSLGQHNGNSCGDWGNPLVTGSYGVAGATNSSWLSGGSQACGSFARIYCVSP